LKGKACIIGRGLIIHADEDDLGNGANEASKINGNSGKRIACAIIGISKDNC
jgi:Cu/Zn superoxide dismutase